MNKYLDAVNDIVSILQSNPVRNAGAMMGMAPILPRKQVKPTVTKTFVYPDYAAKAEKPAMISAVQESSTQPSIATAEAPSPMADILSLLASSSGRPVRNKQVQTKTPYAREDMIASRNKIGEATRYLDEALKQRENFGYSLANALSAIPQQEGAGSWLTDFARGFGGGFATPTNLAIDRAVRGYTNQTKDLENRLKYDKELGETVETDLGYFYPESNNNELALAMMLLGK